MNQAYGDEYTDSRSIRMRREAESKAKVLKARFDRRLAMTRQGTKLLLISCSLWFFLFSYPNFLLDFFFF